MSMASRNKPPARQRWLAAWRAIPWQRSLTAAMRALAWQRLFNRRTAVPLALLAFASAVWIWQPPREIGDNIEVIALPELASDELAASTPPAELQPQLLPSPPTAASEEPDNGDWRSSPVRNGDNLSLILNRWGIDSRTTYQLDRSSGGKLLRRLIPGETIKVQLDEQGELQQLIYAKNQLESEHFVRNNGSFSHRSVAREPERLPTLRRGVIDDSLFLSGQRAQLPDRIIMELANIFGWDIDFIFDIREGDSFALVYEEKYLDGELLGSGNILAAKFVNRGKVYRAVRFEDGDGAASMKSNKRP